jgi:predicted Zn-dependent peptidase
MWQQPIDDVELAKVKNKIEANLVLSEINILNKAMNLAYFELLGDADMINHEAEKYQQVTSNQIARVAKELFSESNCSTLLYKAIKT